MGLYPCSLCSQRFRGAAQAAYPSVVWNDIKASRHLRLCEECFVQVTEYLAPYLVDYSEHQPEAQKPCPECGKNDMAAKDPLLFVTLYPKGQERVDAMADLHPVCAQTLEQRWSLV